MKLQFVNLNQFKKNRVYKKNYLKQINLVSIQNNLIFLK